MNALTVSALDELRAPCRPVDLGNFHPTQAFFTSREPTVVEIGECIHFAQKVRAGEYWLGELSIPVQSIEPRSSLPIRFSRSESDGHIQAKYSANVWLESLGYQVNTEDRGWDLSAVWGNEKLRIECGTTPLHRMNSLHRGNADGFVVVTMAFQGMTELPAYLVTLPAPPPPGEMSNDRSWGS